MNDAQLKSHARKMLRLIGIELSNFKKDYEGVYVATTNHGGKCYRAPSDWPAAVAPSSKPVVTNCGSFCLKPAMHNNGPSTDPATGSMHNTLCYMFDFLFPTPHEPRTQLETHINEFFSYVSMGRTAHARLNIVLHVYDILTLYGEGPDKIPCDGTISRVCAASKALRAAGFDELDLCKKIHDFAAKHAVPSTRGFEPVCLSQILHLGVLNRRHHKIQVTPENLHHELEKVLRSGRNVLPVGLRKLYNEECATKAPAQHVVVFLGVAQAGWYWRGSWRSFLFGWITKCTEARPTLAGQPDVPAKQLQEFEENKVFNDLDKIEECLALQTKPPGFKLWTRTKRAAWLREHVRAQHKVPV